MESVDIEIVQFIEALNLLPGVKTLQSCSGHKEHPGEHRAMNGHVWLSLDEPILSLFEAHVDELTQQPGIESVAKLYSRGHPAEGTCHPIEIEFRGLNWNQDELLHSTTAIWLFLTRILEGAGMVLDLPA